MDTKKLDPPPEAVAKPHQAPVLGKTYLLDYYSPFYNLVYVVFNHARKINGYAVFSSGEVIQEMDASVESDTHIIDKVVLWVNDENDVVKVHLYYTPNASWYGRVFMTAEWTGREYKRPPFGEDELQDKPITHTRFTRFELV